MASEGPLYPGSGTNDASVGSENWIDPNNITFVGSPYTVYDPARSISGTSYYLKSGSHGFSIPTEATIVGIILDINRRATARDQFAAQYCVDNSVRLVKAGSPTGDDKQKSGSFADTYPTTLTTASYGGITELWGTTWTPSEINNTGFGAVLSSNSNGGDNVAPNVEVNYFLITVYYTLPVPPTYLTQQNGRLLYQQNGKGILL